MPRILVTGAEGFIGAATIRRLCAERCEVVTLDIAPPSAALRDAGTVGALQADVLSACADGRVAACAPEIIIHLAARPGIAASLTRPRDTVVDHLSAFVALLEVAASVGARRVVYASSSSAADPRSPYAVSKAAMEQAARAWVHLGVPSVVGLRLHSVYGPNGRPDMPPLLFLDHIAQSKELALFDQGRGRRDLTFVTDTAEAIVRTALAPLANGAPVFDVGTGTTVDMLELVARLERLLGQTARLKLAASRPFDRPETLADPTQLEAAIGWRPEVQLDDGLRQTVDWFMNRECTQATPA